MQKKEVEIVGAKSFKDIAKDIIKNSIRSAVCIDDVFEEPYMTVEEKEISNNTLNAKGLNLNNEIPTSLYKSFRRDGICDLDIYNFKSYEESWHPEYMLNNKDLVILDWELEGTDGYESTLKILKQIVDEDKIPFIIIYTYKPNAEFRNISKQIVKIFNSLLTANSEDLKSLFLKEFTEHLGKVSLNKDWDIDKAEIFFDNQEIYNLIFDIFLSPETEKQNVDLFFNRVLAEFEIDTIDSVVKKFGTVVNKVFGTKANIVFSYLSQVFIDSDNEITYNIERIKTNEVGFRINNCVITLFSKPSENNHNSINPENVFTKFSDLISSAPHNFITLLSLEMRERFKEDLSRVGNDISLIDEKAFFVHLENYKNRFPENYKIQFYDFLLNSWINELSTYNINLKPQIFTVIDEYIKNNNLENLKGVDHQDALAELASILSTIKLTDRFERDNKIRFGDLFKLINFDDNGDEIQTESFLLSITPHCVCLDECKIDNNFYFIKSEDASDNFKSGLEKIETEFYSLIKNSNVSKSIKWGECKPFTLYIQPNILNDLYSTYQNEKIKLEYITTLKENFAQRIANKAFGYGTAVGIDLPHLRK